MKQSTLLSYTIAAVCGALLVWGAQSIRRVPAQMSMGITAYGGRDGFPASVYGGVEDDKLVATSYIRGWLLSPAFNQDVADSLDKLNTTSVRLAGNLVVSEQIEATNPVFSVRVGIEEASDDANEAIAEVVRSELERRIDRFNASLGNGYRLGVSYEQPRLISSDIAAWSLRQLILGAVAGMLVFSLFQVATRYSRSNA